MTGAAGNRCTKRATSQCLLPRVSRTRPHADLEDNNTLERHAALTISEGLIDINEVILLDTFVKQEHTSLVKQNQLRDESLRHGVTLDHHADLQPTQQHTANSSAPRSAPWSAPQAEPYLTAALSLLPAVSRTR